MAAFQRDNITFQPARVLNIVLNSTSKLAKTLGGPQGHSALGHIEYELINAQQTSALYAKPFNNFIKHYPLKNEIVLVFETISKEGYNNKDTKHTYYLTGECNLWGSLNHNAFPKESKTSDLATSKMQNYFEAERGILPEKPSAGKNLSIDLGEYFKELPIKQIQPYEGDYILEGRFGHSIRMGSTVDLTFLNEKQRNHWSEDGIIGDPITIIRNGFSKDPTLYSGDDNLSKHWIHTQENINTDPSSIYLTSNQKINNFIPSGVEALSMLAKINPDEYKTDDENRFKGTKYFYTPKLNNDILPESHEEDVITTKPTIPNLVEENLLNSELSNIDGNEITPYYLVEGNTDNNKTTLQTNIDDLYFSTTYPTGSGEINLNQFIGQHFQLIHLISTPKSQNIEFTPKSYYHIGALYQRDKVGFYVDVNNKGKKTINVKEYLGVIREGNYSNPEDIPSSSYNTIDNSIQIRPSNNVSPYIYSKTNEQLIREAESLVFGNYSNYGLNNYPGIDIDIDQSFIIENLKFLFRRCIDHIIEQFSNLELVSVYRSKHLNQMLGKNPSNSEHIYGYAADIRTPDEGNNMALFNWCVNNLSQMNKYTNLMWAFPERGKDSWVHISYIPNKLFENTILASENDYYHNMYEGTRRGTNKIYQDNIKEAITPPNFL